MRPKWILEKDIFREGNPEKMFERAMEHGSEAIMVGYIPFGNGFTLENPGEPKKVLGANHRFFPDNDCVIVYGSINLIDRLCGTMTWTPTAWYDSQALKCSHYYVHWGQYLLQRDFAFVPFGALPDQFHRLLSKFGEDGCLFVRPDDNKKTFTGRVVHKDQFEKWYNTEVDCYEPNPYSMAVVARPQNLAVEWRFVVVEGKIVTQSSYRITPYLGAKHKESHSEEVTEGATGIAQQAAADAWQPDKAYVLDVGLTWGGEYRVVEIGSVNCAGLYGCDVVKVVDALSDLAEKQWREAQDGPKTKSGP